MRIVIELKRDAIPNVVLNQLYKHTSMQSTFGVIMLALDNGAPKVMNLKELLQRYIEHRHEVIVRRTQFDLDAAQAREHILEGLKIAVDNIDEVIKIIRGSEDTAEADTRLRKRFGLSEKQSDAILNMRLAKLTGLEIEKLEAELKEVRATIKELKSILASKPKRMAILKEEMHEVAEQFRRRAADRDRGRPGRVHGRGPDRRGGHGHHHLPHRLHQADPGLHLQAAAARRARAQRRRPQGRRLGRAPLHRQHARLPDVLQQHGPGLLAQGARDPAGRPGGAGQAGGQLHRDQADEQIAALVPVREFTDDKCLIFATRQGTVKKTVLSAYGNVRTNGICAINIDKGDELIDVQVCDQNSDIVLATKDGMSIRFHQGDVREMGRATTGVKGIELEKGDEVIGMVVVRRDATLLVVSEKGYGKRSELADYRVQKRGGKGIITLKKTDKTGPIVALKEVIPDDELMMITRHGVIIRLPVDGIRVIGRNTQGVKVMNLDAGDAVVDVARVVKEDEGGSRRSGRAVMTVAPTAARSRLSLVDDLRRRQVG